MKKMGWDWAIGMFKKFSIVFFVFLKLVRPQETIENIIIHQHPILKATSVKPSRVKQILETFGDRCLIIFDGLDEHALGKNQDLLEIIRGEKLPYCNIIATSRPHCTAKLEQYFHIIAQVNGSTKDTARQFAMCLLKDDKKVEEILNFSIYCDFPFMMPDNLFSSPILLLFLCILVRENEFDLETQSSWTGIGVLHFRLSKCLYRKFAERKGIPYVENEFLNVMAKIGELAWEMFRSKDSFQKSNVIKIVGADAFDYGFLIGHEDYRLFGDETADVFITFVHQSLQDFCGAFYFIWSLFKGKTISALVGCDGKTSPILTNPLLLQFCLWFARAENIFPDCSNDTYQTIISYISAEINQIQLDLRETAYAYPALNFLDPEIMTGRLVYFQDILCSLDKTKQLVVCDSIEELKSVLRAMKPVLNNLSSIFVNPELCIVEHSMTGLIRGDNDLHVTFQNCPNVSMMLGVILRHFRPLNKRLNLNVPVHENVVLIELMNQKLSSINLTVHSDISFTKIKVCPFLTHLSVKTHSLSNFPF